MSVFRKLRPSCLEVKCLLSIFWVMRFKTRNAFQINLTLIIKMSPPEKWIHSSCQAGRVQKIWRKICLKIWNNSIYENESILLLFFTAWIFLHFRKSTSNPLRHVTWSVGCIRISHNIIHEIHTWWIRFDQWVYVSSNTVLSLVVPNAFLACAALMRIATAAIIAPSSLKVDHLISEHVDW